MTNGLIGRTVEWRYDHRPMPGNYPGDDDPDSPCWDMSLTGTCVGTIIAVRHSFWLGWVMLIQINNGPENSMIEIPIHKLKFKP